MISNKWEEFEKSGVLDQVNPSFNGFVFERRALWQKKKKPKTAMQLGAMKHFWAPLVSEQ